MFPMSITIASRAELQAVMAALADTNPYARAKAISAEPDALPTAAPQPAMPDGDIRVAKVKPQPALPAVSPESAEVDMKSVSDAITHLASSKGREAAVAILKQFGAARVPELKASDYPAVLAAAQAALAGKAAQ